MLNVIELFLFLFVFNFQVVPDQLLLTLQQLLQDQALEFAFVFYWLLRVVVQEF